MTFLVLVSRVFGFRFFGAEERKHSKVCITRDVQGQADHKTMRPMYLWTVENTYPQQKLHM